MSKGGTLASLCRRLALEKEAVIAFGDTGNDVSMKDSVGCFVAMGNAGEDVKHILDAGCIDIKIDFVV